MEKKERDFSGRPYPEQEWMLEHTWCANCNLADLGLIQPIEFEEDGKVFLEGLCRKCKNRVVSEIVEKDGPNNR